MSWKVPSNTDGDDTVTALPSTRMRTLVVWYPSEIDSGVDSTAQPLPLAAGFIAHSAAAGPATSSMTTVAATLALIVSRPETPDPASVGNGVARTTEIRGAAR